MSFLGAVSWSTVLSASGNSKSLTFDIILPQQTSINKKDTSSQIFSMVAIVYAPLSTSSKLQQEERNPANIFRSHDPQGGWSINGSQARRDNSAPALSCLSTIFPGGTFRLKFFRSSGSSAELEQACYRVLIELVDSRFWYSSLESLSDDDPSILASYLDFLFRGAASILPEVESRGLIRLYHEIIQLHRPKPAKLTSGKLKPLKILKRSPFADSMKAKFGDFILMVKIIHSNNYLTVGSSPIKPKPLRWTHAKNQPFHSELMRQTMISHPNILPSYGVFTTGKAEQLVVVTPWARNGDICNYANGLSMEEKLRLLHGTTEGLQYLHSRGIYHGALYPNNILVSDNGTALIADVCISRVAAEALETDMELVFGPSVTRWRARELSLVPQGSSHLSLPADKGDIWSFGALMFMVLTGLEPYSQSRTDSEIFSAHRHGDLPTQGFNRPTQIDKLVWNLMLTCWYDPPETRPSFADICERLRGLSFDKSTGPSTSIYPDVRAFISKACKTKIDFERVYCLIQVRPVNH
ncbi:hypothetical protein NP233_g4152 [Leucocoprinus birnbaumii]|uniref:Protein kinase domain-containing protein n=1 Tax=Leucocoprinus birnbaumii TaxID=56174 RepID=A0AAD5YS48_9AGAR|nr:hypothetical protein NP233_g4152 [Leucocoprinus birnbaumii]